MSKYDPMDDEFYGKGKTSAKGPMTSVMNEIALFESMNPTPFEIGAMTLQVKAMRMALEEERKHATW